MSDSTINIGQRTSAPDSPGVDRYKIWIDDNGKPRITDSNGITLGFESIYGSDFSSNVQEGLQSNNTTTFQGYNTLNYTINDNSASAIYEVEANVVWNYSSGATDYRGRISVNGTPFKEELRTEPKDGGADQRNWSSIKYRITGAELASLGGTIVWEFASSSGGNTARTYYCYLNLKRVS